MTFGIWLLVFIVSLFVSTSIIFFLDLMEYKVYVAGACLAVFGMIASSLVKKSLVKDAKKLAEKIVLPKFGAEDRDKLESYIAKSQVENGLTEKEFMEMEELSKYDRVHSLVLKASKSEDLSKNEIEGLIEELSQISKGQN